MHLTGQKAVNEGFFEGGTHEDNAKPASYDLSLGYVVLNGDTQTSYQLAPHQTITLVSEERIDLPDDVVAYAMPKTGLTQDSILALGTGIVDPGWNGKLSTVVINFGKTAHLFRQRDPFLRLVFHKLDTDHVHVEGKSVSDEKYKRQRIEESLEYPNTFLDVPGKVEEIRSDLFEDIQLSTLSQLVVLLAVVTAVFALWNIAGVHLLDRQRGVVQADTTRTDKVITPSGTSPPISPFNSAPDSR